MEAEFATSDPDWTVHDVFAGSVTLPVWMKDQSWYEFISSDHPLESITVIANDLPAEAMPAWVRQRRERIANTGSFGPSEIEAFFNPNFPCEGFSIQPGPAEPSKVSFFVGLGAEPELTTLLALTTRGREGLVHALVERIWAGSGPPQEVPEGWLWRRVLHLWVPVPATAHTPQRFEFEGRKMRATIRISPIGADVMPWARVSSEREQVATAQGLASDVAWAQDLGPGGEDALVAYALVQSETHVLQVEARAWEEDRAELQARWNDVVRSIRVVPLHHSRLSGF